MEGRRDEQRVANEPDEERSDERHPKFGGEFRILYTKKASPNPHRPTHNTQRTVQRSVS